MIHSADKLYVRMVQLSGSEGLVVYALYLWYLYQMVTQSSLHTCHGKQVISEEEKNLNNDHSRSNAFNRSDNQYHSTRAHSFQSYYFYKFEKVLFCFVLAIMRHHISYIKMPFIVCTVLINFCTTLI